MTSFAKELLYKDFKNAARRQDRESYLAIISDIQAAWGEGLLREFHRRWKQENKKKKKEEVHEA